MGTIFTGRRESSLDGSALDDALKELHSLSVQRATVGILGVALGVLILGAFGLNRVEPALLALVFGLSGVAWLAHRLYPLSSTAAGVCVVVGLLALLRVALQLWPNPVLVPWFSLVVLVAGALLGMRWGLAVTLGTTIMLILGGAQLSNQISGPTILSTSLLSWASLFTYWLISRPTETALNWAWSSYEYASEQTQQARTRQGELARLSKSLTESYDRLERLSLELDRARRVAQEARQLKAQFAAAISHELRTPLNLVIGFCEMMVLSPTSAYGQRLPAAFHGDLEAIYRNACHISALVDDILDLSQIDADRMALHREWTTLDRVAGEAGATVEKLFVDRDLSLEIAIPGDLPPLNLDRTRIRQILINLLTNAARFTEHGGVTIQAERVNDAVVVAVQDTGPGIPAEERPRVFEEFHQAVGSGQSSRGSGLGLAVSLRFAELHGGTMWVESQLGHGSTFYLRLPISPDAPPALPLIDGQTARSGRLLRGQAERRVLVVDESGQVHRVFERYLDGYRVLRSLDLGSAQKLAAEMPIHALILDLEGASESLPWSDLPPELANRPVISCELQTIRQTARQLGATDYMIKPISRTALRAALRRVNTTIHRILVVDDDPEMIRLLARMLHSIVRGCEVISAADGEEAIDCLRQQRPDVVLLDILMPRLNGYDVLAFIRKCPDLSGLPVLVVTARGLEDEKVVVKSVSLARADGMSVGDMMRWIKGGLDALLEVGNSVPERPATPPG